LACLVERGSREFVAPKGSAKAGESAVDVRGLVECLEAWQQSPGMKGPTALLVPAMVLDHQTWKQRGKGHAMDTTYEYKFVRLGDYRGSAWFGVSDNARGAYEDVVHEYAQDGWRLVQIFAPGVAAFGAAKYYELIFEREHPEHTPASADASRAHAGSPAGA
jgi:Domain of unknown function (DUF4177)